MMVVMAATALSAAPTVTWTNITGNALWNTTDQNWVGPSNYVDGYNVLFSAPFDPRTLKNIFIGSNPSTPVDVAPGTSQWANAGVWSMSGGGITGGAKLIIGWDCNVTFTNYGTDSLTFTNGTIIDSGWLTFCPTSPGIYHFGTGPIIASQRGAYVGMKFMPTVSGCTLVNDFIVPSTGSQAPLGGANWYGTINGGKILGTITMNGPISMVGVTGTAASNRLDSAIILTGNRQINAANGSFIFSPIDGGGTNELAIYVDGNNDAWTDWSMAVMDDTNTPVWNIGAFRKLSTGNTVFKGYRDLGSNLFLRTGAAIMGGLGFATNLIRDNAAVNMEGGKIVLRRDTTSSQTETVGSVNLRWGHNEVRLIPTNNATYTLAAANPLTRANYATCLMAANDLGGSGVAAGSGRITFPSAPPLIGGGGAAGSKNISIVPFLLGGLTTDAAATIAGDSGSTFVTYDPVTGSLRNLNTASEFKTTLFGAAADENVLRSTNETLSSDITINSLVLDASTRNFTIDGAQALTLNSGALLFKGAATRCATVDVAALDFAGGEGVVSVVDTVPSGYGNTWLTINSVIRNGGLTKAGYGRLDLRGNSTFTGPFVVNSSQSGVYLYGTLATTNIQLFGGSTYLVGNNLLATNLTPLVDSRAAFYVNGRTQTLANVKSGPSGGGTVNLSATGQLTLNPAANDTNAFTGTVTLGTLIKEGTNVLIYSGALSPAVLRLKEGIFRRNATGGTKVTFEGGIYELSVSTRDWSYSSGTAYQFMPLGGGWSAKGANITIWPGSTVVEWGVTPNFLPDGAPFMFNTIYSDGCVQYDGPFNLGNTVGTPQMREIRVADNPASANDYAYIANVISGTAADKVLWKTGDGLLQLYPANSYTGGTRISSGTIKMGADVCLGGVQAVPATNVTFDGGGLQFSAAFTVQANRTMLINTGKTATLDTLANAVTINGKITGGNTAATVLKMGTGTLTLWTNDYVALNLISNGTISAAYPSALGANGNALTMGPTATLDVGGQNLVIGALNGPAGALITNVGAGTTTNTFTVDFNTGTAVFSGLINNGATRKLALTKSGSGTLVLNGTNSYTGPTLVNGGTLGGSGSIAGNVTVTGSGTIMGGMAGAPGTLRIAGNLVLQEGSRLYAAAGSETMGRVSVTGTLTVPTNATLTVDYAGGGWGTNAVLISASSLAGVTSGRLTGWTVEGSAGTVVVIGNDVVFRRSTGTAIIIR